MFAVCPYYGKGSCCERLKRSCKPTAKGCLLFGKARLLVLNGRDGNMSAKIETLDLRLIPPVERYDIIIKAWNNLNPGELLKIINDHDPRPLREHFAVKQAGKFEWKYEQEGPVDWIVKIMRI